MSPENNELENKAKIKMLEMRFKALIKILEKEGVLTNDEVEEELSEIFKEEGENKNEN